MTVRKGLKSLAESTPNFSNQALENAINELKIGWVSKSIDLDTAIANNTVLTTSQKNDVKDTINKKYHTAPHSAVPVAFSNLVDFVPNAWSPVNV